MPLLYGESAEAFHHLQEEIIRKKNDETIFLWTEPQLDNIAFKPCSIFARYPSQFVIRSGAIRVQDRYPDPLPYAVTNLGLHISVRLVPLQKKYLSHTSGTQLELSLYDLPLETAVEPHNLGYNLFAPIPNCKHVGGVLLLLVALERLRESGNLFALARILL
ncbi:hypothetical protein P154DRAFT_153069 [Amniculicola lignicola CBS 123094]|uniref:Heterokaryon incompatibility domain-containing protein n=1 Tax=Amniculicola lignicola CBS 123094 TaxID=1392246 RepID=A0A6A5W554_9PLEO|nr:hypothetical protein P154DRAFT_153069 [Amniculicola lignicola CBS 123094]